MNLVQYLESKFRGETTPAEVKANEVEREKSFKVSKEIIELDKQQIANAYEDDPVRIKKRGKGLIYLDPVDNKWKKVKKI